MKSLENNQEKNEKLLKDMKNDEYKNRRENAQNIGNSRLAVATDLNNSISKSASLIPKRCFKQEVIDVRLKKILADEPKINKPEPNKPKNVDFKFKEDRKQENIEKFRKIIKNNALKIFTTQFIDEINEILAKNARQQLKRKFAETQITSPLKPVVIPDKKRPTELNCPILDILRSETRNNPKIISKEIPKSAQTISKIQHSKDSQNPKKETSNGLRNDCQRISQMPKKESNIGLQNDSKIIPQQKKEIYNSSRNVYSSIPKPKFCNTVVPERKDVLDVKKSSTKIVTRKLAIDKFRYDDKPTSEDVSSIIKSLFGHNRHDPVPTEEECQNMESSVDFIEREECLARKIAAHEDRMEYLREKREKGRF